MSRGRAYRASGTQSALTTDRNVHSIYLTFAGVTFYHNVNGLPPRQLCRQTTIISVVLKLRWFRKIVRLISTTTLRLSRSLRRHTPTAESSTLKVTVILQGDDKKYLTFCSGYWGHIFHTSHYLQPLRPFYTKPKPWDSNQGRPRRAKR